MANLALITGASSGIGRDLARIHAARGGDLVVVARRRDALESLKAELERAHGVSVRVIAADLTADGAVKDICRQIDEAGEPVRVLVNSAGFGGHGKFHERAWKDDAAMIQLNILALAEMTHRVLQDMVRSNEGKILNVASTAGMLPGPLQATYYATKAFVLSFSQAIAEELIDTRITVTALCPGPVDTEFGETAGIAETTAFKNADSSRDVARVGYQAMEKGKLVAINDWKLSLMLGWIKPFLPRRTVLKLSRRMMEKT